MVLIQRNTFIAVNANNGIVVIKVKYGDSILGNRSSVSGQP